MSNQQAVENSNEIRFSRFSFNFDTRLLSTADGILDLPPKSTEILNLLLKNPGELVSREQISKAVWGDQIVDFDQNINFCIKQIRQLLEDEPRSPQFIATLPKKGYRFIAPFSLKGEKLDNQPIQSHFWQKQPFWISTIIILISAIGLTYWFTPLAFERHSNQPKAYFDSSEAEQAVKRGFYLFDQGGAKNFLLAEKLFEKALVLQPTLADAHAGLALVKIYNAQTEPERQLVINHAVKGFALNPQSAFTNLAKAEVSLYLDWNIGDADQFFKAASQIDPNSIAILHELAVVATIQGDFTLAKTSIEKALDLDPGRFQEHFHAGWFYQAAGQYDNALKQCSQSLEIEPDYYFSLLCAGRSALKLELVQKAKQYLQKFMQIYQQPPEVITQISKDIEQGDATSFNRWYIDLLHQRNADPFELALAYGEIGETDNALNALQSAIDQKHIMVPTAWAFDELRETRLDNRFGQMMSIVKRY